MKRARVVLEIAPTCIRILGLNTRPVSETSLEQLPLSSSDREGVRDGEGSPKTEELSECLKNYRERIYPDKTVEAYVLLPLHQNYLRSFILPWINKRDRKTAFRYLIDEEVPIPADDRVFHTLVLQEDRKKNSLQVAIGAARLTWIQAWVKTLAAAGLEIAGIDFAPFALGRAMQIRGMDNVLCLQKEDSSLKITLCQEGIPLLVRSINQEADRGDLVGESYKKDWLVELHRMLAIYKHNYFQTLPRIITDSSPITLMAEQYLIETGFGQKTDATAIHPGEILDHLAIYGHAERIRKKEPLLDLRPLIQERKDIRWHWVALMLIFIQGMGGLAGWYTYQEQKDKWETQIAFLQNQLVMEKEPDNQKDDLFLVKEDIGENIRMLTEDLPLQAQLQHIEQGSGGLLIRGRALKGSDVQDVLSYLKELGWVSPGLQGYTQDPAGQIEFSITSKERNQ